MAYCLRPLQSPNTPGYFTTSFLICFFAISSLLAVIPKKDTDSIKVTPIKTTSAELLFSLFIALSFRLNIDASCYPLQYATFTELYYPLKDHTRIKTFCI